MEEQRLPGHLDVEGEASSPPVRSISVPGLTPRHWSQCHARWALTGTATALLLMAVVVLGFGDTAVARSAVTSHTTAFTPGFLAPSIQRRPLTMHRPKLVTLIGSTVAESRPRFALQMKPDAKVAEIREGNQRGIPTLTAEDEERGYLAAVANGDFHPSVRHPAAPEPASSAERKPVGLKAQAIAAFERGEAATLAEALTMLGSRTSLARYDKYTAEEVSEMCRKANLKAAQNLVDSGKATSLREAQTLLATKAVNAMIQRLVDNGEAATLEEAWTLKGHQMHEARLAKFGEFGLSKLGIQTAQAAATRKGKYVKYHGVHKRKDSQRWRVQFNYRGEKLTVPGGFGDEHEAALAHDAYVKEHGLIRPLHFPENDTQTLLPTKAANAMTQHLDGMPVETRAV